MTFDPQIHHRRSIRLNDYDYSQAGLYFVTIVTQGRVPLFGEVVDGEVRLNRYGEIIQKWWDALPGHFSNVETGAFVIIPNHVHGIIIIGDDRRGTVPENRRGKVPNNCRHGPRAPRDPGCDPHIPGNPGRGDPAPTETDVGTNRCVFQISIHQRNQCAERRAGNEMLAAQLLRTYHPQPARPRTDLALYRIQPCPMG